MSSNWPWLTNLFSTICGVPAPQMVEAWECAKEAAERRCSLQDTELMQQIARYNEVDCRVMMEIVKYLRWQV